MNTFRSQETWASKLAIFSKTMVCMAASANLLMTATAETFDLANDFSTTQNPSGAWSYNMGAGPIASTITGAAIGFPYLVGWGLYGDLNASITQADGNPDSFWKDLAVGDVTIHTYGGGDSMSVTWTSSSMGVIDISGAAWDAFFESGRNASWSLSVAGVTLAQNLSIFGILRTDSAASFSNNVFPGRQLNAIPVNAGDVLTFATVTSTGYGHFMGVDLTVEFTPIPEPTAISLAGLGLLVFVARWRRIARG